MKEITPEILTAKYKLAKMMFESRSIQWKREPLGSIITASNASATMQLVVDGLGFLKDGGKKKWSWALLYYGWIVRSMIGLGLWSPEELGNLKLAPEDK